MEGHAADVTAKDAAAVQGDNAKVPPELKDWLALVGLAHREPDVARWCDEQGASFLEEVAEHVDDLAEDLNLDQRETSCLTAGARSALAAIMRRESCSKGSTCFSLRTLSTAAGCSEKRLGPGALAQELRSSTKGISRVLSISATMNSASSALKSAQSPGGENQGLSEACGRGIGRTCTLEITGPRTTGILAHMATNGGSLQVAQVARAEAHGPGTLEEAAASPMTPLAEEARRTQTKRRSLMARCDTLGVASLSGNNRQTLVGKVHAEGVHEVTIDSGQTGNVYALEVGSEKIAVFKPVEGEKFERKSLDPGQGSTREEAVYLVDRIVGSKAGVPVTSRASIKVDGEELRGSVQAFVQNSIGFIEDFAMPRELSRAEEFVPQETAEAVAMLDMRVFNMDRHSGNLLLLQREKPHSLGPIDHGCCLPHWWSLSEAIFDAWLSWPQLQQSPGQGSRDLARKAYEKLQETCDMVQDVELDAAAVITLRLCTLFVFVGIAELGLACGKLAALMLRDEETGFQDLSWLEQQVLVAANSCGAECRMQVNDRGDQEVVVERGGEGLEVNTFLGVLERTFRSELEEAVGAHAGQA